MQGAIEICHFIGSVEFWFSSLSALRGWIIHLFDARLIKSLVGKEARRGCEEERAGHVPRGTGRMVFISRNTERHLNPVNFSGHVPSCVFH